MKPLLSPKRRLLLVDGNNVGWRWMMSHVDQQLRTSGGIVTTVAFGVVESITKAVARLNEQASLKAGQYISDLRYDDVIVCWDSPGRTWRHDIDETYKANRNNEKRSKLRGEAMPYFETATTFLSSINMKQIAVAGLESDDLIGIISALYAGTDWTVTIVSADADMWQLMRWGEVMIHDGKERFHDAAEFMEKYGFDPSRWAEAKALMGDSGDNVQGVDGVGEVLATKITRAVEHVLHMDIASLPKIPRLSKGKLEEIEKFRKSGGLERAYRLVKIPTNVQQIDERYWKPLGDAFSSLSSLGAVSASRFTEVMGFYEMERFLKDAENYMRILGLKAA